MNEKNTFYVRNVTCIIIHESTNAELSCDLRLLTSDYCMNCFSTLFDNLNVIIVYIMHLLALLQDIFGVIRCHYGFNEHPSAAFRGTLRLTVVCQMVKSISRGNCMQVNEDNLLSMMDTLSKLLH